MKRWIGDKFALCQVNRLLRTLCPLSRMQLEHVDKPRVIFCANSSTVGLLVEEMAEPNWEGQILFPRKHRTLNCLPNQTKLNQPEPEPNLGISLLSIFWACVSHDGEYRVYGLTWTIEISIKHRGSLTLGFVSVLRITVGARLMPTAWPWWGRGLTNDSNW